jgi:hypothetical protein
MESRKRARLSELAIAEQDQLARHLRAVRRTARFRLGTSLPSCVQLTACGLPAAVECVEEMGYAGAEGAVNEVLASMLGSAVGFRHCRACDPEGARRDGTGKRSTSVGGRPL